MELKQGPGGLYTADQWVVVENTTNERAGTFSYRYRYLGEDQWEEGDSHHDEMLRSVSRDDDVKMMVDARVNMIEDSLVENYQQVIHLHDALVISPTTDADGNLVFCCGGLAGPNLRIARIGRPGLNGEGRIQVHNAAMEAAALLEEHQLGVISELPHELVTEPKREVEIVCAGCGEEGTVKCWNCKANYPNGHPACPTCGATSTPEDTTDPQIRVSPQDTHPDDREPPQMLMEPMIVEPAPGWEMQPPTMVQEPPQPPPPMTNKVMPMHVACTPDASATVHRFMAALAPPMVAHAFAATVLNFCEENNVDPKEFVDDLRGTLKRCAEEWGTNRG